MIYRALSKKEAELQLTYVVSELGTLETRTAAIDKAFDLLFEEVVKVKTGNKSAATCFKLILSPYRFDSYRQLGIYLLHGISH